MQYFYESEHLRYEIIGEEEASKMLAFFSENRAQFDPYEPDKPGNFYTLAYMEGLATIEKENYLRSRGARYWISRKNQPGIYVGNFIISNIVRGSFQFCNIGYKIHHLHQRQGYAKEAVSFMCEQIFHDLGLHRCDAYIHPANLPSIRTVEACGFQYVGRSPEYVYMHGKWEDHLRYTLFEKQP